jgi:hypothetical protein
MSGVRKFLGSQLERSLFNEIALFCAAGLCLSLTLVLAYGLRIAGPLI